ncbi:MAG TPA: hypothetical protein VFY38_01065 [Pseudonocardia sp.]|nr:hypothetical protein [Pseudonocardia sp.]
MTADGWVWVSLGLLLALLGARAWVVESGHATLGRTPVKVTVLTGACGLVVALVVGLVTVNGGARLVYLVLHPAEAQALEDAANAEDLTTAPDVPTTTADAPVPAIVAPPAPAPPAPAPTTRAPATRAPAPRAPAVRATRAPVTRAPVTRAPVTRAPATTAAPEPEPETDTEDP